MEKVGKRNTTALLREYGILNLLPDSGTKDTSPFLIGPHDSASAGTFRQYEPTYGDRLSALLAQGFIRRKCQSL